METISVIAIGEPVKLNDDISAVVTAMSLRSGPRILYEIVWWAGKTRKCEWVESFEVATYNGSKKQVIGFKTKAKET